MSLIARMTGFPAGGSPAWPLSEPPEWRGFPSPVAAFSAWWPTGRSLALDFANARYMREGASAPLSNVLSVSRMSPATWVAADGTLRSFAANVPAITGRGLYLGDQRVNKCRNLNAGPLDLANLTLEGASGGAADPLAVLEIVDDPAALAAAGLSILCPSGKVYRLNNSAASASSRVLIEGVPGNTGVHALSCYMRGTGNAQLRFQGGAASGNVTMGAAYQRVTAAGSPNSASFRMYVLALAGADVFFILNQLEESSFVTPPIVTAGEGATTRLADAIAIPDFPAIAAHGDFDEGMAGRAVAGVTRLSDPASRCLFDIGSGTASRVQLSILADNRIELSIRKEGEGPLLQTAALAAPGSHEIEWQAKSGASFVKIGGVLAASSAESFDMPPLLDAWVGRSRTGASALNGAISWFDLGGAA